MLCFKVSICGVRPVERIVIAFDKRKVIVINYQKSKQNSEKFLQRAKRYYEKNIKKK